MAMIHREVTDESQNESMARQTNTTLLS